MGLALGEMLVKRVVSNRDELKNPTDTIKRSLGWMACQRR
jgi:hypothetical protein